MKLLKALTGIMLIFLLFCSDASAAQITKTLDENTRITPPGVVVTTRASIPMFKKETVVILNDFGEVVEGILAEDISLPYETGNFQESARTTYYTAPPQVIIIPKSTPTPPVFIPYSETDTAPQIRALPFKGGTKVVFNDRGEVVRGTLSSDQTINLNPANRISVSNAEISFHKNGMVATCTLASDSYLRPVGWSEILTDNLTKRIACSGFVEFKASKPIELNDKGEVVKGTLNNDTKLLSASTFFGDGSGKKLYKAGTAVEFDSKGNVIKAQES
ncbi:MAG: hypothetical protein ABFC57_15370 [Veillonellales bacterium]